MNPAPFEDPKLNPPLIQICFWICCIFRSGNESSTIRRSNTKSNFNSDLFLNLLYIQIRKWIHHHVQIQYWIQLEFRSIFESVVYSDPEMNPEAFRSGNESITMCRSNTESNLNSDLFLNLLHIQIIFRSNTRPPVGSYGKVCLCPSCYSVMTPKKSSKDQPYTVGWVSDWFHTTRGDEQTYSTRRWRRKTGKTTVPDRGGGR